MYKIRALYPCRVYDREGGPCSIELHACYRKGTNILKIIIQDKGTPCILHVLEHKGRGIKRDCHISFRLVTEEKGILYSPNGTLSSFLVQGKGEAL
jgi:hypothetical protein